MVGSRSAIPHRHVSSPFIPHSVLSSDPCPQGFPPLSPLSATAHIPGASLVGSRAEDGEPPDQTGSDLIIVSLGVAVAVELGRRSEKRSSEPDGVALLFVRNDVDVDSGGLWVREEVSGEARAEARRKRLTRISPPLRASEVWMRVSTMCLRSRCRRRPKWSNMVDPPERTMFCAEEKRVSSGSAVEERRGSSRCRVLVGHR